MPEVVAVTLIAGLTVLATGLGALPVVIFGDRAAAVQPLLDGLAIGVMLVAAISGLLIPAVQIGTPAEVSLGAVAGAGGLTLARRALRASAAVHRQAQLTFGVLFVHSLPEGLALGAALAHGGTLGAFVVLAISIQNIPEGTATAAALRRDDAGPARQVGAATATSLPQLPGALAAWAAADIVAGVLPAAFAAAGVAMLLLVLVDLVPAGWQGDAHGPLLLGTLAGAGGMVLLALVLHPPA